MKKEKTFFAKQLKKIMSEKDITQQKLGEKLNVSQTMVSQWLRGLRYPTLNSLQKISKALDVPTAYFLEESSINKESILVQNIKEIKEQLRFNEEKMKRFETELELLKIKIDKNFNLSK